MRISRGTYYSGSWSSTNFFPQISFHPRLELNPSSPELAGQPTSAGGSWNNGTFGMAWVIGVAWFIYRIHMQTQIKSVRSVYRIETKRKRGGVNPPFLRAGKINTSFSCYMHP